jgi:hypothetical protein
MVAIAHGHDPDLLLPFKKYEMIAGSIAGEIYVAENAATGTIIGAAIWFGPGREMFDR